MARKRAVILKLKTWQIVKRIIRDYLAGRLTNRPPSDEPRRVNGGVRVRCGLLTEDLDAPTYVLATPTTATCHPLKWDEATAKAIEDTDTDVEVTNIDPELSGHSGYLVWWFEGLKGFGGKKIVASVGCTDVRTAP